MTHDRLELFLSCRNVSFQYPNTPEPVLKKIYLDIQSGRCYCLIGLTGSDTNTSAPILKGCVPYVTSKGAVQRPHPAE